MECDSSEGYINGNMRERVRLMYSNVMVKIQTLLNSREYLKDLGQRIDISKLSCKIIYLFNQHISSAICLPLLCWR